MNVRTWASGLYLDTRWIRSGVNKSLIKYDFPKFIEFYLNITEHEYLIYLVVPITLTEGIYIKPFIF